MGDDKRTGYVGATQKSKGEAEHSKDFPNGKMNEHEMGRLRLKEKIDTKTSTTRWEDRAGHRGGGIRNFLKEIKERSSFEKEVSDSLYQFKSTGKKSREKTPDQRKKKKEIRKPWDGGLRKEKVEGQTGTLSLCLVGHFWVRQKELESGN